LKFLGIEPTLNLKIFLGKIIYSTLKKIPIIRWERDSQPILESGRVKVSIL